jgi:MFS family permease
VVDRYGVKVPYAISYLIWGLFSAATGLTQVFWQILTLRLCLGLGEAIVTPASMKWIRDHCLEKERGLAVGIYMAGTKIGPAVGVPLTAMLIEFYGWRVMFFIVGLGGLLLLIPWQLLVPRDYGDSARDEATTGSEPDVPFAKVLASPVLWGIVIGSFSYNYFSYFCMTWLPAYFVERRGLSLQSMGLYTMASFGGMALMAIFAGWFADRLIAGGRDAVKVRKAFTIAGLVLASTEVFGAVSDSQNVALFFAIFSLTGLGVTTANFWALTQTIIPGKAIGRIAGVQNFAANLAGIVSPVVTGWLKQVTGSYDAPMKAIWVALLIGVAAYLFLVRRKYAPRVS